MAIDITRIIELKRLVTNYSKRKPIIVLPPESNIGALPDNTEYDKANWKIPNKELAEFVKKLADNCKLSNEEKILALYEKLCRSYIYDDNLISYIRKVDDDSYELPEGYGRVVDEEWEKNREQHNRRVCYEVSRYLAKSLIELFKNREDVNVCILWDKALTHYFVGLTCDDYSLTLDLDDFNNIKDLTRIKAGLSTQGIIVLDDNNAIFQNALDKFNSTREQDALKQVENNIASSTDNNLSESYEEEPEDITFLKNTIKILKERYSIDSQGMFEYLKEIIDMKFGPDKRKKVWKIIRGNDNQSRCIRCLTLNAEDKNYIIDVDDMFIREFDLKELEGENAKYISHKELTPRSWHTDKYNGL